MIKTFKGTIKYRVLPGHPDIEDMTSYDSRKVWEYSDIYKVDLDRVWSEDYALDTINSDLRLVAGGGYNSKYIDVIDISIKRTREGVTL